MSQPNTRRAVATISFIIASHLTAACGNADESSGPEEASGNFDGTVTEAWTDYCAATLTADYEVIDVFGDVAFTAREGESYLVSSWDAFSGGLDLYFLTPEGADDFVIESDGEAQVCDRL